MDGDRKFLLSFHVLIVIVTLISIFKSICTWRKAIVELIFNLNSKAFHSEFVSKERH